MNYRHAYHAGNFADVLKHLVLTLVIDYMSRKEAPFRVIDTHAGCGRYTLGSIQAGKTGEWRSGIGRLLGPDIKPLPSDVANVMRPYLDAVRAENPTPQLEIYPGSPLIARRLMRKQDVLVANELHPEDCADLESAIGRDRRVKLLALDGWVALKSLLPPKERRAVVLIDPPFEQEGEFDRLAAGLAEAIRRFETGVYIAWYPIKDPKPIAAFHSALGAMAGPELLRLELMIRGPGHAPGRLNGCGLIVANPPFTLHDHMAAVLPELTQRLAEGSGARHRLDRIARTPSRVPVRATTSHRRNAPRR
jgi:23S rRNA (adenine2030-N6)-methyltransferase